MLICYARSHARALTCFAFSLADFHAKERLLAMAHLIMPYIEFLSDIVILSSKYDKIAVWILYMHVLGELERKSFFLSILT